VAAQLETEAFLKLAWISDCHLDHADEWVRMSLAEKCAAESDAVVIVPPFVESAWHNGQPSEPPYLPWYTNKAMGVALNRFSDQRKSTKLLTLCGHVHSASRFQARPNHEVLTAAAEYEAPEIARVFDL
jgi:hypothetical protein